MDVLRGVRVVDLTMWAFVPAAGGILAHWGADVVKVEPPTSPDPARLLGGSLEPGGASFIFKHYSRGKRGIALDLRTTEGHEVLAKLVERADVFLTSYLPRTRQRLGFDVDDVRAINPSIIYARGTGHGPRGPEAERPGYDGAVWWCRGSLAHSGMLAAGIDEPLGAVGHGDGMSGMTLAGGICAALYKRAVTGEPSIVDASLLGTAIWFNGMSIISSWLGEDFQAANVAIPRIERHPTNNMYRTKDGRFLITSMLGDFDDEWVDFCQHLGVAELATDPRFLTSPDRTRNCADAVRIFDEIFAQRTYEEWLRILVTTKGVWSPVQTAREMHDDPQTLANGFIRDVRYPQSTIRLPVPPVLFDEEGGDPPLAPDFGQHTDEVLAELGYDTAAVARLHETGVVA